MVLQHDCSLIAETGETRWEKMQKYIYRNEWMRRQMEAVQTSRINIYCVVRNLHVPIIH